MESISNAKNYIEENINHLLTIYPELELKYVYDHLSMMHIIKVLPTGVVDKDDEYLRWEDSFTLNFIKKYPKQNIVVFSDDDSFEDVEFTSEFKSLLHINDNIIWKEMITESLERAVVISNFTSCILSNESNLINEVVIPNYKHMNIGSGITDLSALEQKFGNLNFAA
jgi:hypothetical protein